MRSLRTLRADEAGLTLIELMISVGILGLVIGPIITSFLLGLLESTSARDRIADSSSAQLTTAYLHADIQGSQTVATTGACLPSALAGGTVVLQLAVTDPAGPDPTVAYVDFTNAEGQRELHRATCTGATSESRFLIQHLQDFEVTCDVDPCPATPKTVKVAITAESPSPDDASSYSAFTFEIDGVRRVGT
jgi:Tfp pilus assembly protein PilW